MDIGETFYTASRKSWRAWLAKNHATKREIWLIYPNKASGKKRIPYNDAVEEALCYGWIDSTMKRTDGNSSAQRFTPRKSGSGVSWMNKERIWKLVGEGRMTEHGLAAVSKVFDHASRAEDFAFPKDIIAAIRKDKAAWQNFRGMPERYKRIRVAYIDDARGGGPGVFEKRLRHFIRKTAHNKRFGMMTD